MNATLQRKRADFSKLQILLQLTLEYLVSLKHDDAEWCSETESCLETLEEEHSIEIGLHISGSARSIKSMDDYHSHVAPPYIDAILANI